MFKDATLKEYIKVTDPSGKKIIELCFTAIIALKDSQDTKTMQIRLVGDQLEKELAENGSDKAAIWRIILKYVRENYTVWAKERGVKEIPTKVTTSEDIINEFGTHIISSI